MLQIGIVQDGVINTEDSFAGLDGACGKSADIHFEMDTLIHQIKELLPDCQNLFIEANFEIIQRRNNLIVIDVNFLDQFQKYFFPL